MNNYGPCRGLVLRAAIGRNLPAKQKAEAQDLVRGTLGGYFQEDYPGQKFVIDEEVSHTPGKDTDQHTFTAYNPEWPEGQGGTSY